MGQTFLIFHLLFSSALRRDKRKNKINLTELPILAQRLRPRTLDPVTHARISGGPNFFDFSFIYYVVLVRYDRIKEKEQLILT